MKGARLDFKQSWLVGAQLGAGGFGRVYELSGGDRPAVAKFVPKAPGADRELLFVNIQDARNLVPIIDSGEYEGNWVLVMPRAQKSLRDHLQDAGGVLPLDQALPILIDVTAALADLNRSVVHRDIKPENVLLLNGAWCLADFGISRYAAASTAPDTHKWALSPPYAAPERWRADRATGATDIYSLGVIGFEMLMGQLPFPGPTWEDFRDQHLHRAAPTVSGAPTALATVLDECLFKSPAARPSAENLRERLTRQRATPLSGGLAALQSANQAEVRRRSEADRAASAAATDEQHREARAAAAQSSYERISSRLHDAIVSVATAVEVTRGGARTGARNLGWALKLGPAVLRLSDCQSRPATWAGWPPPAFTVDAWASLSLRIPRNSSDYEGRTHSLWFGDIQEEGHFAWYETAFMHSPLARNRASADPFGLDPGEEAAKAVWNGMAEYQVAWPFSRLDPEGLDEFIERWAGWFASAAGGSLHHPSRMPERETAGSWRRT